jgi:ABC-type transporter Mla MlaB component
LTLSYQDPECTLSLAGSLDADSIIALESQFDQLSSGRFERVVLDVSRLPRLDQAGTRCLARLGDLLLSQGAEVSLAHHLLDVHHAT